MPPNGTNHDIRVAIVFFSDSILETIRCDAPISGLRLQPFENVLALYARGEREGPIQYDFASVVPSIRRDEDDVDRDDIFYLERVDETKNVAKFIFVIVFGHIVHVFTGPIGGQPNENKRKRSGATCEHAVAIARD